VRCNAKELEANFQWRDGEKVHGKTKTAAIAKRLGGTTLRPMTKPFMLRPTLLVTWDRPMPPTFPQECNSLEVLLPTQTLPSRAKNGQLVTINMNYENVRKFLPGAEEMVAISRLS